MRNQIFVETLADERAGRIIAVAKRALTGLFFLCLLAMLAVLLMEVKREYSIDLIQGVNFQADDWYFENTGR
jgi:hypothetical protein